MRRSIAALVAAGCLLGGALLTGCGSSGGGDAALLRVGTGGEVDTLSPFLIQTLGDVEVETLQFPFLVQYDSSVQIKPDFATSWKSNADSSVWTFKLAKGARWSDGAPLTSDDVAWSFNTYVKYAAGATASVIFAAPDLAGATATSPDEVAVKMAKPAPWAVPELANLPILPRHVWEKQLGKAGKGLTTFNNPAPNVGGGPFYVSSFTHGQFVRLLRNPHYYGPKPHVRQIGFRVFSNPDALTQALQHNEIDAAREVPPASVKTIRAAGINVQAPDSLIGLWMTINASPNNPDKEMANPLVRQAFEAATDRARIANAQYFGQAEPASSILPPPIKPYYKSEAGEPFDLAKANALLDQAGYKRGSDGVRVANGHRMSYNLLSVNGGQPLDSATKTLHDDFAKIGVQLNVSTLDIAAAIPALVGAKGDNKSKYQLAVMRNTATFDPGSYMALLTCAQRGVQNVSGYCDKQFDALYAQQAVEPSAQKRIAELGQMQDMIARARPVIPIAIEQVAYAYANPWSGFHAGPLGWFLDKFTAQDVHKG